MNSLEFLHAVEDFIGRSLDDAEGDQVIADYEAGESSSVEHVADLWMAKEDLVRVYGALGAEVVMDKAKENR